MRDQIVSTLVDLGLVTKDAMGREVGHANSQRHDRCCNSNYCGLGGCRIERLFRDGPKKIRMLDTYYNSY